MKRLLLILYIASLPFCKGAPETTMCAYYTDAGVCTQKYPGTFLFVHSKKKLVRTGTLKDYANSIYFRLGDTVGFTHSFGQSFSNNELANYKQKLKARFYFTGAACGDEKEPFEFNHRVERFDFYPDKLAGLSLLGTILGKYHKKRGWQDKPFSDWQKLCPGNSIAPFKLHGRVVINGTEAKFPVLIIP